MTKVSSTDFRVAYSSLTEPTEVTVLGRVIGRWIPTEYGRYYEPELPTANLGTESAVQRIATLEAEVRYLTGELAARLTTKVPNVHAPAVAVRAGIQPVLTNAIAGEQPGRGVHPGGFGHSRPALKPSQKEKP